MNGRPFFLQAFFRSLPQRFSNFPFQLFWRRNGASGRRFRLLLSLRRRTKYRDICLMSWRPARNRASLVPQLVHYRIRGTGRLGRNFCFASRGFLAILQPRPNAPHRLRRNLRELQSCDLAVLLDPNQPAFAFNARTSVERKVKGSRLPRTQRHHGSKSKSLFAKIPHHASVARGQLHIDERRRAFAKFAAAISFNRHSSRIPVF